MADKKEQFDSNAIKNIADLIGLQSKINTDITNDIYGTANHDLKMDDTKTKISSLMSDYKQSFGGNFFDSLKSMKSDLTSVERTNLSAIKNQIENNKNVSMFQNMLNSTDSLASKYEDLALVTSIMPQLKQARKAILNSILSPDDFTKQISLNMDINGKSLATENPALYKSIDSILKKYKLTSLLKYSIDRTITLGKYYVAVLPYSKLYGELIARKNKGNTAVVTGLSEGVNIGNLILNEEAMLKDKVTNINNIKTGIMSILENTTITNESMNLFDEEIIEHELLGESKSMFDIEKLKKSINKNKKTNNATIGSDGTYTPEELKKPNISGAKVKKLDPRRLIALNIDEDNCMGYYYIENNDTKNMIKNSSLMSFKNNLSNSEMTSSTDLIYKNIGDLLWKKLDHKFVENHPEIKERMYDILKYSDVNENSRLNITFLEPDEVIEYKINDGESAFESSLFFARLYLMVLLSTITARVVRSNDVRAYYVDTDSSGGVNSMVYNAMNTLQQSNRSVLSMNNVTKLISNFSVFEDIFIPRSMDDKKPLDFDIISGQQVDLNNDVLEMLEQICVDSSGVPLQLIKNAQDVDFARTYTMLNIDFMKRTLDQQTDLNPSITETIRSILRTEIVGEDDLNIVNSLECYLQSPMNLLLTNLLEQINNAKDIAQGITDVVAGQTGSDVYGDVVIDKFTLEICKKYAPNIPWNEFIDLIEELKLKNPPANADEEV